VIPVQILLIIVAMVAFNQGWNVEEERPIGGRRPDSGARPGGGEPTARDEERPAPTTTEPRPATNAAADDPDWDDGPQRVSPAF
jgi:hypothetical protein